VVGLIAVGKKYYVADFTTHLAARTDSGSPVQFRTHFHHCVFAHGQRAAYQYPFQQLGVFAYIYGTFSINDTSGIDNGPFLNKQVFGILYYYVSWYMLADPALGQ